MRRSTNPSGRRRVLVVDDDVQVADSLAELLAALGHDAHAAYAGEEALEAARRLAPAVVILDICLPDMPGQQVARRLREHQSGTTLIALTGFSWARVGADALADFDHHLVKPLDIDRLEALLDAGR
jgi:DNA-binding response OmpR family regulator